MQKSGENSLIIEIVNIFCGWAQMHMHTCILVRIVHIEYTLQINKIIVRCTVTGYQNSIDELPDVNEISGMVIAR